MAEKFTKLTTGAFGTNAPSRMLGNIYNAKEKVTSNPIAMAGEAVGDTFVLGEIPAGAMFRLARINASVSLGSARISIGTPSDPAKFVNAAAFTTPDEPKSFAKASAAASMAPQSKPEKLIATITGAALPGAGDLVLDFVYADLN